MCDAGVDEFEVVKREVALLAPLLQVESLNMFVVEVVRVMKKKKTRRGSECNCNDQKQPKQPRKRTRRKVTVGEGKVIWWQ